LTGSAETVELTLPPRPLLRGVLHEVGLAAALVVGTLLIVGASPGRASVAAAVFASSVALMLTMSTLYHRVSWPQPARLWMRRGDHAGIYLLIAGSYTPIGLISLRGTLEIVMLALVWSGATLAAATRLFWAEAPNWISAVLALSLGWIGVVALPDLWHSAGWVAVMLILLGGAAYSAGAVVYIRHKPDPAPRVFGYHEVFHALTLIGIVCQYVAIAFFVIRSG
jgi:hemolysin III